MMIRRLILCFSAITLAVTATLALTQENSELFRGSQLLLPFKQSLGEALQVGLSLGVVEAIQVCQIQAPAIADSISDNGILVGRTSHKLRNSSNISPDWVEPILAEYASDNFNREPRSVAITSDRRGYVEPIVVQPLCLSCHGESLDDDVSTRISELYPEDQAIGYSLGDLRGVFWLEYPANTNIN